jgi:prepilin-type N-terminal cleavage/methylation domain-containing protein
MTRRWPHRCPRRGSARAGFTLIELTVALVAGLVVALAIVALSKEATTTFHDEMRSSAAEATLRTAVDRLRADLNRAAFMSTANVVRDPWVATPAGVAPAFATFNGIARLAGIRLADQGSLLKTPKSADQSPALAPDALEIGGNMTSVEQFDIQTVDVNTGNNCARITVSSNSPALYRIGALGGAGGPVPEALTNIFQPVAGSQFIVRIVDDAGCSQFLPTCPGNLPAGFTGGTWFVDVDEAVQVLTPSITHTRCGITPTPGHAKVNPVQIARWEIVGAADEPAWYTTALGRQAQTAGTDPAKYDLVRSWVDANGTPIPSSMEIVAEYAVDLDFAFSVENGIFVVGNGVAGTPSLLTFPFDSPLSAPWADIGNLANPNNRPERIRIVRARVATRTALPDRAVNLPVGSPPTDSFLYRYCLVPPCGTTDGTPRWARVRTLTAEVALHNQSGAFYP